VQFKIVTMAPVMGFTRGAADDQNTSRKQLLSFHRLL